MEQLYLPNPCIIRLRFVDPQTAGISGGCDGDPGVVSTWTLALSSSNTALMAIPLANIEWSGVCEDAGVVLGV